MNSKNNIVAPMETSNQVKQWGLAGGLTAKVLWALAVILFAGIHLVPDEAQYWTWSQNLDWGYYSKPPGIAWQIALTTAVFGDSELGVRFGAVGMSVGLVLATYLLARTTGAAIWSSRLAAFCLAWSPMGLLGSVLSTTDGGFVLFWTLACIPLVHAQRQGEAPRWAVFGLLLAIGALFKWPIYLLWIPGALGLYFYPHWRTRALATGIGLSLLALLPSVIWNWTHDWATFRHVATQIMGGNTGHGHVPPPANPLDFFGAQLGLVFPVFYIALVLAIAYGIRNDERIRPLAWSVLALLAIYHGLSLLQKMQGNWAVFAYPPAFACMALWLEQGSPRRAQAMRWGIVASAVLMTGVVSIPRLQSDTALTIPYALNPFRQSMGWDRLTEALSAAGYSEGEHFLAAEKYQMTSLLSFYG
ncbi:MAG: glycosyltransferase family 39 protein, partial [Chlamydiia bacterium]|nr:glycosyltransferase family 39 protein [Chlamydiia bacterium]